jgi:topoisomerase-4 subunit A
MWYDTVTGRLNRDERGDYIGTFDGEDKILVVYKTGEYELTSYELTNRYEADKILSLSKLTEESVISAIHIDGASKVHYVKRFGIETKTVGQRFSFIHESKGSSLVLASILPSPVVELTVIKGKAKEKEVTEEKLDELIDVKGWKAIGNKLSQYKVQKVRLLEDKSAVAVASPSTPKSDKPAQPKEQEVKPQEVKPTEQQPALFATEEIPETKSKPEEKPVAKKAPPKKTKKKDPPDNGFDIGTTIEFDF